MLDINNKLCQSQARSRNLGQNKSDKNQMRARGRLPLVSAGRPIACPPGLCQLSASITDLASHRYRFRTDSDRQTGTSRLTYQQIDPGRSVDQGSGGLGESWTSPQMLCPDRLFPEEDHQSPESKPSGKDLYCKFELGPSVPQHTRGPRTMRALAFYSPM